MVLQVKEVRPSQAAPLLRVEDLRVLYGRAVAVAGVSIDVPTGSIRSIVGVNGAGKSSTLRAIAGLVSVESGSVEFDGHDLTEKSVDAIVSEGIALVPEQRKLFASMTVMENLRLGAYGWSRKDSWRADAEQIFDFLPELKDRPQQQAGSLSGGEQQMLAIGRALMARPRLLMLDEPCTGLAPIIVGRLAEMIQQIAAQGLTVLLIEQNAQIALEISDYGYVMETGAIVLEGPSVELSSTDYVRDVYLGV